VSRSSETRPARRGEELDRGAIESFLAAALPDLAGPLEIRQFPSGASNLTYLLIVGDREVVLRRPPPGRKAKTAHDMAREVRILEALAGVYPYVPRVLAFCRDQRVLGSDFYLMERIDGVILRRKLPAGVRLSRSEARALSTALIDRLIELHSIDHDAAGLGDFGKPVGYVRRQIDGWSKRYRQARTPNAPPYERVMAWLDERAPGEAAHAVIHGDYRFDNVVLDRNDLLTVRGVLDWEMATIGDPLMDLGASLAYWIGPGDPLPLRLFRLQPTHLPGMLERDEVVAYYLERTGLPCVDFTFYRVYGVFRLVVIMQQIYYRYYHGQTRNRRFATFIYLVKYLERYLEREIATGEGDSISARSG
jgi:aminoglycoside phosphotransferase (APT) family kinase protein